VLVIAVGLITTFGEGAITVTMTRAEATKINIEGWDKVHRLTLALLKPERLCLKKMQSENIVA
jgi:hypothetical protein